TPLAAGIRAAVEVASRARGDHRPLIVLVSDGRATSSPDATDPFESALAAADDVRRRGLGSVVVDVDETQLGLAGEIAARMGARHMRLPELSAASLVGALQGALGR